MADAIDAVASENPDNHFALIDAEVEAEQRSKRTVQRARRCFLSRCCCSENI